MGPVEESVRADIAELGDLDPAGMEPSLAATAVALSAQVDAGGGEGGRSLPALTRELRATIEQILRGRGGPADGEGDDGLGDVAEPV